MSDMSSLPNPQEEDNLLNHAADTIAETQEVPSPTHILLTNSSQKGG